MLLYPVNFTRQGQILKHGDSDPQNKYKCTRAWHRKLCNSKYLNDYELFSIAHGEYCIHIFYYKRVDLAICTFLRVQNEQFSEEKGFILRYTEKEV